MFTVIPNIWNTRKEIHIESGIDRPTNSAFLTPRKNIRTNTTKITPEKMLFSNVLTCSLVFLDWLFTIIISISFGIWVLTLEITSFTLSLSNNRFVPDLFATSTATTGLPPSLK